MTDDRARMLETDPDPRHPGIAIRIREIDVTANENVVVVRAARRDDQRRENYNFSNRNERTPHPAVVIENPRNAARKTSEAGLSNSKIENRWCWSSAPAHDLFVTIAGL